MDISCWTCCFGQFHFFFHRTTKKRGVHTDKSFRQIGARVKALQTCEKVGRVEIIAYGMDFACLVEIVSDIEFFRFTRNAKETDQVSTSGAAPNADLVRVKVIFFGVCFEPTDRSFAIFDLSRKWSDRAKTVWRLFLISHLKKRLPEGSP